MGFWFGIIQLKGIFCSKTNKRKMMRFKKTFFSKAKETVECLKCAGVDMMPQYLPS